MTMHRDYIYNDKDLEELKKFLELDKSIKREIERKAKKLYKGGITIHPYDIGKWVDLEGVQFGVRVDIEFDECRCCGGDHYDHEMLTIKSNELNMNDKEWLEYMKNR